tara:strand:- start:1208 stop:2041 length:834 start_codon:yes stop_codon:yes gene_type:complete
MTISSSLIELIVSICHERDLPAITHLHRPPQVVTEGRHRKFGMIALADGSCGFFYTRFDDTLSRLMACDPAQILAASPLELLRQFDSADPLEKALALGVLNAASQHLLRAGGYALDLTHDPMGQIDLTRAKHVGMVGFFPPLVDSLANRHDVTLTVIEKDEQFFDWPGDFLVTSDTRRLGDCDRVLITGSTLMNNSLDDVLACCDQAAQIALIGPTASCLPDPLFERGIDVIGSTTVVDLNQLLPRLAAGESWGIGTAKYCISRKNYPGIHKLLGNN